MLAFEFHIGCSYHYYYNNPYVYALHQANLAIEEPGFRVGQASNMEEALAVAFTITMAVNMAVTVVVAVTVSSGNNSGSNINSSSDNFSLSFT